MRVIFMDSEMPNMSGLSATRLVREQLGYKGLIIGVTGNTLKITVQMTCLLNR